MSVLREGGSEMNFCGVPSSILGNEIALRIGRQKWVCFVMLMSAEMGSLRSLRADSRVHQEESSQPEPFTLLEQMVNQSYRQKNH